MRSYEQFCGAARALDLVGDRWTLLIVRDLLPGPLRFRDLGAKLPGIASDVLTGRLRSMEGHGLVERIPLPAPASATGYQLTATGRSLRPLVLELTRFGVTQLDHPLETDAQFDAGWGLGTIVASLGTTAPDDGGLEVAADGFTYSVTRSADGTATLRYGPNPAASVRLSGPSFEVLGVLLGHVEAEPAGVALEATASAFRRWRAAISATAPAAIKVPSTAPSIDAPRR